MDVLEKDGGTLIKFGNKLNGKIKVLFSFEAFGGLLAMGIGIFLIYVQLSDHVIYGSGTYLFLLAIIVIGAIVFWRYFSRISRVERMFVTKDEITITKAVLNKIQETSYEVNKIHDFNYLGKAKKTDHPLKGNSFDYLGFETQELVIAEVNNDGNLSFSYEDKLVSFGRDVYSWDAEKLNDILLKVTEGRLKIGNLPTEIDAIYDAEYPPAETNS